MNPQKNEESTIKIVEKMEKKSIKQIAKERDFAVVRMEGFGGILDAIIGFETEDEARKLAEEEHLMLVWTCSDSGGWSYRDVFSGSVNLDPEDIGAISFARTEEDVYRKAFGELQYWSEEYEASEEIDLDELMEKLSNCKAAIDVIRSKKDCDAVPYFENGYDCHACRVDDVISWYNDSSSKRTELAAIRDPYDGL